MKKKSMLEKWFLLVVMAIAPLNSYAKDVFPETQKPGSLYIKVSQVSEAYVKFESCRIGMQDCKPIGKKTAYSLKELVAHRFIESDQALASKIAYVGIGITSIAVGGVGILVVSSAIDAVLGGSALAGSVATLVGTGTGLTAAVLIKVASQNVNGLEPYEQNQQAKTLSQEVITDRDVSVDSVEEFAERLELVLNKIE